MAKKLQQKLQKVSVYIRIRTAEGKQPYCKAIWETKKRLKPHWCLVHGTPEHHPEGIYQCGPVCGLTFPWPLFPPLPPDRCSCSWLRWTARSPRCPCHEHKRVCWRFPDRWPGRLRKG